MSATLRWETVIGCEIHVELATRTKAFCGCANRHGGEPNTRVCPVCLGLPGAMPAPSDEFLRLAAVAGFALDCSVDSLVAFDRKHFFYPDLPKGFQITQADRPLCREGFLEIEIPGDDGTARAKKVRIERIHLEEDAGKSVHGAGAHSFIDFNRSGVPLVEIVTRPDMSSPEEASLFMKGVRDILRYAGVTDGNLEEGSLRCDANVNLRVFEGDAEWRTPISEIKNLNSFRSVRDACAFEVARQLAEFRAVPTDRRKPFAAGFKRTVGWDEARGVTFSQREKNSFVDYRFVPEPDIPPIRLDASVLEGARGRVGELPVAKRARYIRDWGITPADATTLSGDRGLAEWFEEAAALSVDPRRVGSWILSEALAAVNARGVGVTQLSVKPRHVAELADALAAGRVSGAQAKAVFAECLETGKLPSVIIEARGLSQINDEAGIGRIVDEVLAENGAVVENYRKGKANAAAWLTGQVMKRTGGRANPALAASLVQKKLAEL